MEYVTLNNGIKMPMAGIGTFLLTPDEAESSVLSALSDGYRLIDTANAYVNEKAVGRAMKKSGLERKEIFLETKLWPSFYNSPTRLRKLSKDSTPTISTCFLFTNPQATILQAIAKWKRHIKKARFAQSDFQTSKRSKLKKFCPFAK